MIKLSIDGYSTIDTSALKYGCYT